MGDNAGSYSRRWGGQENLRTSIYKSKKQYKYIINNTVFKNIIINNIMSSLPDIREARIAIIYVYYERKNEQKNQTNLSFFIKYGLNDKLWTKLNISTLFVVNGHQCEVIIPTNPNVYLLKEDNCSDWEGWYNGIKYFENKEGKKIWEQFDYLCLINAGAIGPIYEQNSEDHWLIPFYNKMVKDNAVICSPCMSFLPNTNPGGPGPKVVPIFSLIRCTEPIINLLTNVQVSCTDKCSINLHFKQRSIHLFGTYENTVLGPKKDKQEAVLVGEYGLSRILVENSYRITSLLYDDNFDCHDPANWGINGNMEPDRYMSFNGQNVPLSTIFIKNIWRWEDFYVCLPVLYDECKNFVYSKLNMKSIFQDITNISYNYDLLNVKSSGKAVAEGLGWNSKQDFYNKYGLVEEVILYNKPSENFNGCLIYAHYDTDNIVKDYVIQTIKTFRYLGYDILFFTASSSIKNVDVLPCNVIYVENDGPGTDWKIWLHGCNHLKKYNDNQKYSHIFLLNDSIILPVNGVVNFGNTIKEMRATSDFWGHWESNEIEWHIVGTPIEFKYSMINDVIFFIQNKISLLSNRADYALNLEVKFAKHLVNRGYKWNTVIKFEDIDNKNIICPIFNPVNIQKWMNNPNTFAIKWKYIISYLNQNIVSPELNYLTRYLYYGKYGFISKAEKMGLFPKSKDE